MTTLRIPKTQMTALLLTCASRLIQVDFITEDNESQIVDVLIDIDPSQALYLMIEFGQRIEQDIQFNQQADRISGHLAQSNDLFSSMVQMTKPN